MKQRYVTLLITICLVVVFHLEVFGLGVRMKDDRGHEIQLPEMPQRIISLVPSHSEILFALGLEDRVKAVSDYCILTGNRQNLKRVGGFMNPSVAEIVALKPDLVLALGTVQLDAVQKLEEKGMPVFWFYPGSVNEVLDSIQRIGKLTGKEDEARRLRQKIEAQIREVTTKLSGLKKMHRPKVLRVMGTTPPASIGGKSFQTDVFRLAGGENCFAGMDKDYFQMDVETLTNADPDVVIICGTDKSHLIAKLKNTPGWKELKAVKKGHIMVISCNIICRPGPNIGYSIAKIAGFLHPGKFATSPDTAIISDPGTKESKGECK